MCFVTGQLPVRYIEDPHVWCIGDMKTAVPLIISKI